MTAPTITAPTIEAVLIAGALRTTYKRAGSGKPVLLLFAGGLSDAFAVGLFEHLAAGARVVAPFPPKSVSEARDPEHRHQAFSAWLRDLIDGLGLVMTTIVADEPVADVARAFAWLEPERVAAFIALRRPLVEASESTRAAWMVAREVKALLGG